MKRNFLLLLIVAMFAAACTNEQFPEELIPQEVAAYLAENHISSDVKNVTESRGGYKVELADGTKLVFDEQHTADGKRKVYQSEKIGKNDAPFDVKDFVSSYFPNDKVNTVELVTNEDDENDIYYEVTLKSGTEIEFDANGSWLEIECKNGSVPAELIPEALLNYVKENYPDAVIEEIEKDDDDEGEIEIELDNDIEIKIDRDGNISIDED